MEYAAGLGGGQRGRMRGVIHGLEQAQVVRARAWGAAVISGY